jgi:hypothetical protein
MGELINISGQISDSQIPAPIARDTETADAITAHEAKPNPHNQYRLTFASQTFTSAVKAVGVSSGAIKESTAATINKSGFEVQSADTSSAAYISLHRPNVYGCHFGLDNTNVLAVGGWSFGNVSYKVWTELYGTPMWQSPSDRRLKKSIRPIPSGLEFILECKPISFQYNALLSKEHFGDTYQREKIHYGFLADEFPLQHLVAERGTGYLGLDYIEIVPFLCRAIQEQQAQIDELKRTVELLKT